MAAPSAQTLQRLANQTGQQPGTLEKVLRLLDLLQEIAGDRFLGDRPVLKGGTALNLFHLGLDRLSVDIDLNYVGALDRAAMEAERPDVDAAIDRLLVSKGYGIRRRPGEHAGGKWLARYASALGGNATLEVDVNRMARQPLFGMTRMRALPLGGIRAKDVLVLDLHEIVAGKLVALADRHAARDLFDARRIPQAPMRVRSLTPGSWMPMLPLVSWGPGEGGFAAFDCAQCDRQGPGSVGVGTGLARWVGQFGRFLGFGGQFRSRANFLRGRGAGLC